MLTNDLPQRGSRRKILPVVTEIIFLRKRSLDEPQIARLTTDYPNCYHPALLRRSHRPTPVLLLLVSAGGTLPNSLAKLRSDDS